MNHTAVTTQSLALEDKEVIVNDNHWVIQAKDLTKIYNMGEVQVHALRGVSFQIAKGEVVAIMGPSGSGKSTLMNIIGCLDQPTEGEYLLDGEQVSNLKDDQRSHRLR